MVKAKRSCYYSQFFFLQLHAFQLNNLSFYYKEGQWFCSLWVFCYIISKFLGQHYILFIHFRSLWSQRYFFSRRICWNLISRNKMDGKDHCKGRLEAATKSCILYLVREISFFFIEQKLDFLTVSISNSLSNRVTCIFLFSFFQLLMVSLWTGLKARRPLATSIITRLI